MRQRERETTSHQYTSNCITMAQHAANTTTLAMAAFIIVSTKQGVHYLLIDRSIDVCVMHLLLDNFMFTCNTCRIETCLFVCVSTPTPQLQLPPPLPTAQASNPDCKATPSKCLPINTSCRQTHSTTYYQCEASKQHAPPSLSKPCCGELSSSTARYWAECQTVRARPAQCT